ncbi:hypothetical protein LJC42_02060 [Eubacteriales bacterium OttesenSCG-928-K08]|nr:hypothetical protein [Eubacteriales bacterium OttesenSCG-928-K08]
MKVLFRLFLVLAMMLTMLSGCKPKETAPALEDQLVVDSNNPDNSAEPGDISAPSLSTTNITGNNGLLVVDTVAYMFDDILYGGVTYTNTGNANLVLSEAVFTFSYSSGTQTQTYTPLVGERDVIAPGETGCAALFLPQNEGATPSGEIVLNVELSWAATSASPKNLSVANAKLIQNYPSFATLSGELRNICDEDSELSMVYVQFYDEADTLLGVWYFTRNAILHPGDKTTFVVHLQSLPIKDLAKKTEKINFHAFSI